MDREARGLLWTSQEHHINQDNSEASIHKHKAGKTPAEPTLGILISNVDILPTSMASNERQMWSPLWPSRNMNLSEIPAPTQVPNSLTMTCLLWDTFFPRGI